MKMLKIILVVGLAFITSCTHTTYPLLPPQDVETITGDNEIILIWSKVSNPHVVSYRIYRSERPYGYFELIDEVSSTSYVDQDVENGVTYYYALSSVDEYGNESDLTSYPIFDTPRPERYNQRVFAYSYSGDTLGFSGYLLSDFSSVERDDGDFYFTYDNGVAKIVCSPSTYIQDMGETNDLSDINWAPDEGWIEGSVRAYTGHSYVIWTQDNHFAEIRIERMTDEYMLFDVAYQTDPGNHELSIDKKNGIIYLKTGR